MVASNRFTRIDTVELKELIYEKIGHERADSYFDQLKSFLSSKLSKVDFDKSCIQTIGRKNISLHNRLIRAIIHNASQAKTPPQKARKAATLRVKVAKGNPKNHLQFLNGDVLAPSTCKCTSPLSRDRKFLEHRSPLGPLGKSPSISCEEAVSKMQEQQSPAELQTLSGEEVEQCAVTPISPRWGSITAPLGVSLELGSARKPPRSGLSCHSHSNNSAETCQSSSELPDTTTLGRRLQKKLALEGVGITPDGANLLNKGLDVYLKKIVSQYMGIARESNAAESNVQRINASMLDFRVAMESNPSILGEGWSTQLEKICNLY